MSRILEALACALLVASGTVVMIAFDPATAHAYNPPYCGGQACAFSCSDKLHCTGSDTCECVDTFCWCN